MSRIQFVRLSEINKQQLIDLMNNEMVGKQMSLLAGGFSAQQCCSFLKEKERLWKTHNLGPWAFLVHGEFAGWGGLQPEQGDADFALVLHPRFWGWGLKIFKKVKDWGFKERNLASITILLPPSRPNAKAVTRLGFVEDGHLTVNGTFFQRFRLSNPLYIQA